VHALATMPFAGLHLDLEPNQLGKQGLDESTILDELLATLASAIRVSPWPVGFSIHPRYLAPAGDNPTFGARLDTLGIPEVTLMVYVANPVRAHEIAAPILAAHPRLAFTVAQSVEPELSREESWAGRPRAEVARRLDDLAHGFEATKNFHGVVVQA